MVLFRQERKTRNTNIKGKPNMTNLQTETLNNEVQTEEFHTVYVELTHKWTAEKRYHAATIPTLITADEYLNQVWESEGYEKHLWQTDVCNVVR